MDKGNLFIADNKEGHWTIQADKLEFIKGEEVKTITLKDGTALWIQGKDKKDYVKATKLDSPKYKVLTTKDALKTDKFHIYTTKDDKKIVYVTPHNKVYSTVHLETQHEELKEKIKAIREKLKQIKEEEYPHAQTETRGKALKELEEMLAELDEELQAKSSVISYSLHRKPESKDQSEHKHYEKIESDHAIINLDTEDKIIAYRAKDNGFQVIFRSKSDVDQKARHEELLKKLKEKLPPSYKVESETDEEENVFIIKITSDNKYKEQQEDLHKMLKEIIV